MRQIENLTSIMNAKVCEYGTMDLRIFVTLSRQKFGIDFNANANVINANTKNS